MVTKINPIGETYKMNNGYTATIIQYNNSTNLTIQWETGEIQDIKSYAHLKEGKIAKTCDTPKEKKKKRLGETRTMNCGVEATIIEYYSSHNITIQFHNGPILYKKYYHDFKNGRIDYVQKEINNKDKRKNSEELKKIRIGEIGTANNGQKMTIIEYYSSRNITIQFEDGTIREHINYGDFKKGEIANTNYNPFKNRIGEVNIANNGQKMTIIKYINCRNITVRFEDGTVVYKQRYEKFKKGAIVNPNNKIKYSTSLNEYTLLYYFSQLGFKKFEQGSLKKYGFGRMELDTFNKELMIAIEYDGEIHKFRHNTDIKKDKACKKANIELIRIREKMDSVSENSKSFILNNQKYFSNEYEQVLKKILNYISNKYDLKHNTDIDFNRDKEEIENEFYSLYKDLHVGKKFISKEGEVATIKQYKSTFEVIIEFEDGYKREIRYSCLKNNRFPKYGKKDKIYQLDLQGNILNTFPSALEASLKTNISKNRIQKNLIDEIKKTDNCIWIYERHINNTKYINNKILKANT